VIRKAILLTLCIAYIVPLLGQGISLISQGEITLEVQMPACHGERGKIIPQNANHRPSEYSFDNLNFSAFTDTLEFDIGNHHIFLKSNNEIEFLEFIILPTEDISFDFISIIPADCDGKNGRIISSVTGSGSASFPNMGNGTILVNSENYGPSIDLILDSGDYTLTAFLNDNISRDTIINIPGGDCNVYFPNVIYPNSSEGRNTRFTLGFKQGSNPLIQTYRIYDKWGSLIFNRENIVQSEFLDWWDGMCFGERCETGTYSYVVKINFESGKIIEESGTFTLL